MTKYSVFADFETTNGENGRVDVYLWNYCTSWNDKHYTGTNIHEFIISLYELKKNIIVFFHNGSKFDFHYFKEVLSSHFTQIYRDYKDVIYKKHNYDWEVNHKRKSRLLQGLEYRMIVDDRKRIISLKLGSPYTYTRHRVNAKPRNYLLTFKDSCLLFPSTLDNYGKYVNIPKIKFDGYLKIKHSFPSLNKFYSTVKNADEHIHYIKRDCVILKRFLLSMSEVFPLHKWKNTIASTAFNHFLSDFPKTFYNLCYKYVTKDVKWKTDKNGMNFFYVNDKLKTQKKFCKFVMDKVFPTSWLNEKLPMEITVHKDVDDYYSGGLTQFNSDVQGIPITEKVHYYDINSSYPFQMINAKIPYGFPQEKGEFDLMLITAKQTMENKHGLSFLSEKVFYAETSEKRLTYPETINSGDCFFVSTPEWQRVKLYYGSNWERDICYSFHTMNGKELFGEYVNKFWKLKSRFSQENNKIGRFWSKLMLNSLYGKFGEKPDREGHVLYNGEWYKTNVVEKAKKYLPIAIAITANARMCLVDAVGFHKQDYLYCDTDSLITYADGDIKNNLKISDALGDWKLEWKNIDTTYIRTRKQYAFNSIEGGKIVFAGLRGLGGFVGERDPLELDRVSMNDLIHGRIIYNQITPIHYPSGVLLTVIKKVIKPIYSPEYAYFSECWFGITRNHRKWNDYREALKEKYFSKLEFQKKYLEKIRKPVITL